MSDIVSSRGITDMEQGGVVNVPIKDIREPSFRHGAGGDHEYVNAGNKEFHTGDRLPRPKGQSGGGGGSGEGDGEDSQDNFAFSLSREEFLSLFFDDLELPHLIRSSLGDIRDFKWQRAGYTPTGVPCNLSVTRSLSQAMARRIALTGGLKKELAALELASGAAVQPSSAPRAPGESGSGAFKDERSLPNSDDPEDERPLSFDDDKAELLRRRIARVPFIDHIDLRFRHRVRVPLPISRAVMFCLMDVSASMTEEKKDLAKRFFTLLYMFLSRKYQHVDLVFIRHTDDAQEVDEQTFFHDTKSGGTVVLSALKLMHEILTTRYDTDSWNIYGAQVSDGDAFGADPEKSRAFLADELLPMLRYFAYVEVPDDDDRTSPLSFAYERIESDRFAMKAVTARNEVYPVLRELFKREAVT